MKYYWESDSETLESWEIVIENGKLFAEYCDAAADNQCECFEDEMGKYILFNGQKIYRKVLGNVDCIDSYKDRNEEYSGDFDGEPKNIEIEGKEKIFFVYKINT